MCAHIHSGQLRQNGHFFFFVVMFNIVSIRFTLKKLKKKTFYSQKMAERNWRKKNLFTKISVNWIFKFWYNETNIIDLDPSPLQSRICAAWFVKTRRCWGSFEGSNNLSVVVVVIWNGCFAVSLLFKVAVSSNGCFVGGLFFYCFA